MNEVACVDLKDYCPKYRARSVLDITYEWLEVQWISKVLLDLDNTLARRNTLKVDYSIVDHVRSLKQSGIEVIVVSNALFSRRVSAIAASALGVSCVVPGWRFDRWKPNPWCLNQAIQQTFKPDGLVLMVGDQLSDVVAAKRAGCESLLIDPLDPTDYHLGTKLFKLPKQRKRITLLERIGAMPKYIPSQQSNVVYEPMSMSTVSIGR